MRDINNLKEVYLNSIRDKIGYVYDCDDYSLDNFDNVIIICNSIIALIQIDIEFWEEIVDIVDMSILEYLSEYMSDYSNVYDVYSMYDEYRCKRGD